jgi:hypothetical protein
MFTKSALALAVVLATMTGALAATKKQNTNPPTGMYDSRFDQRSSYSNDWKYWHRYDDMGNYN